MKKSPRFHYGEHVAIDYYVVDMKCAIPDAYIHIPDLPKYNVRGESVPLCKTGIQTGFV